MSTLLNRTRFKAPRWIHTDAGHWAYESLEDWRRQANQTFGVTERRQMLVEAEALYQRAIGATAAPAS
jgi:hypothetical protein